MASAVLPDFPVFNCDEEPTSLGIAWRKWSERLENLLVALNVKDAKRKRALLLHYAGKEVHDIYNTIKVYEDEGYAEAKASLDKYFEPKINRTFEIYNFRKIVQFKKESIDNYCKRLKEAAMRCSFDDDQEEIKHQIIFGCRSDKLRRKGLRDDTVNLQTLLEAERAYEKAENQAEIIEKKEAVNRISKPGKYSQRKRADEAEERKDKKTTETAVPNDNRCFNCGGKFPHKGGRTKCPAYKKTCRKCGKPNHFEKVCRAQINNLAQKSSCSEESSSSGNESLFAMRTGPTTPVTKDNQKVLSVTATKKAHTKVKIESTTVECQIDSGASVNIIAEADFIRMKNVKLQKSKTRIFPYGSKKALRVLGKFTTVLQTKGKSRDRRKHVVADFFVVREEKNCNSIIGLDTAIELGLLKIVNQISEQSTEKHPKGEDWPEVKPSMKKILEKHKNVFEGLGMFKNVEVKFNVDKEVKPVANKHRRIPFHLRPKVEAELDRLLAADVIEMVENEPTDWVSPIVLTNKSDGSLRFCVDMRNPNKAIKRTRHVIPTIEELRSDMDGATVFSKVDLNSSYHQLKLHEESRKLTTFATHKGLGRFKVANFGANSVAETFHEELKKKIQHIKGVKNIYDDIFIYTKGDDDHERATDQLLEALEKNNITLNKKKCVFSQKSIKFFGTIFNQHGISPDPEKVEAIQNASRPQNKSEVRSFLGMLNYSACFVENYSSQTIYLRNLTQKNTKWEWNKEHEEEFESLKKAISENCLLNYFDPKSETVLICDGSPFEVGAILTQIDPTSGERKVVAYASRSLTKAERNYGQIDKEALSVYFGCDKFQIYLLGKSFTVLTDHLPLLPIFNNPRKQCPYRLQRIRVKLQGFSFEVKHVKGKDNPSDYISRCPLKLTKKDRQKAAKFEKYVNCLFTDLTEEGISVKELTTTAEESETYRKLRESVETGEKEMAPARYQKVFEELALWEGLVVRDRRLVVPEDLQQRVIESAHQGHQGMVKTKLLLRSKVWFPDIDKQVEETVKNCRACQTAVIETSREPLTMSPLPQAPWEFIITDYHGPLSNGEYIIVIIDEYSRFPIVESVKSTSASKAIPIYEKVFSTFGIPVKVKTDNGSPYNSREFDSFMKYMGIKHQKITPVYPQSNGMVEQFNRMLEKVVHTSKTEKRNFKQELNHFLRNYRTTPHMTTGKTPAELLFQNRTFRTRIPEFYSPPKDDETVRREDTKGKEIIKKNAENTRNVKYCDIQEGDRVLIKQARLRKSDPYYSPDPFTIVTRKGNMLTAERNGKRVTRNSSFFKKLYDDYESDPKPVERKSAKDAGKEIEQEVRRSVRVTSQPVRYPMDVKQ